MVETSFENVYGELLPELVPVSGGAAQYSPLHPGARDLGEVDAASLDGLAMLAPPGTVERRHAMAQALRALSPRARLTVLALKDKGGSRIARELSELGCLVQETSRSHHRICVTTGPGDVAAIAAALREGAPQYAEALGLWSQPGVFSWNRIDPGSALLLAHLPALSGSGADFGCGIGILARAALGSPKVTRLAMLDIDRRAVEMARRNIADDRVRFVWADARADSALTGLDFVVMNPPFHEGGAENRVLGQGFIQRAAAVLRKGGTCWLTANRHLPYEAVLKALFASVNLIAESGGYKVYQARK